ncbi:MAG TPA: ATP-binding protein [Verrucomicrobiae bacterium]|nr:ATP-binding protein [Verrucomicrobiae bacterium]
MKALLDHLPTILILAGLVGTFLSLRRHAPTERVRLWTYAWALIFCHFFIQAFETHTGVPEMVIETIDLASLELSGIVFVVSLMISVEHRASRLGLLVMLGVPTLFHATAITFNWNEPVPLAISLGLVFFGGAMFPLFSHTKSEPMNAALAAILGATGIWAVHRQLQGSPDFGVNAILALGFGVCGILFWKRYRRPSPGVLSVSGGFLLWGAVFPVATWLSIHFPSLNPNGELWNVPKYFVAFGMVLTLIEDKTRVIEEAGQREREENRLLMSFSSVTSRLLSGSDPAAFCGEIAKSVTSASSFQQAAFFLGGEDRVLRLTGWDGFSTAESEWLERETSGWTMENVKEACKTGRQAGNSSFLIEFEGERLLIPLASWRGSQVGFLLLSGAKSEKGADEREIFKLEVLASDLAVTIENTRLHHQLVRSEKLAALGQLVAGVAHELNNPLTGIIGYSDLLAEEVEKEGPAKRVQKLGHEARRMKRIVDGLLRFARQNNPAMRAANLEAALHDVIQLREYHIRKHGIQLTVHVEPELARVGIGEDELKQVLLNILNNGIDAVEESARREIDIRAYEHDGRAIIRFEDSGPGFTDLNRAFDPFFTTKPVGKGTGLGLSICYGIAQECGGEILLANKEHYGASVTLELPVAASQTMPALSKVPA